MEITLQILLGLVAFICLAGGLNLLIKGAASFLPNGTPAQPVLDDLFRFLSGIYWCLGIVMAWVVFNLHEMNELRDGRWSGVIFSGLGRLYSRIKVGPAGKYFDYMMTLEIVLGIVIIILQYVR